MTEPQELIRSKLLFYQGGNHGSCVDIRKALDVLMKNKLIAPQKLGPKKRELGFRQAVFCPIPIGEPFTTCHNLTQTFHNLTQTCYNLIWTFHNLTRTCHNLTRTCHNLTQTC